jgi:hypothetical protein
LVTLTSLLCAMLCAVAQCHCHQPRCRVHLLAQAGSKRVRSLGEEEAAEAASRPRVFVASEMLKAAAEAKAAGAAASEVKAASWPERDPASVKKELFEVFAEQEKVWVQDLKGRLRCAEGQFRALVKELCDKEKAGAKTFYKLSANYAPAPTWNPAPQRR